MMNKEFHLTEKIKFLNFQVSLHSNSEELLSCMLEQFMYPAGVDLQNRVDDFQFFIRLTEGKKDNTEYSADFNYRYNRRTNSLDLSYLEDRISVRVDYSAGEVHADVDRSVLSYGSALGNWVFTIPMAELMKLKGYYFMHAACLAVDEKACLFAGKSGQGKTTIALGLLQQGWNLISDDEIFLMGNGAITAYGGPEKAKITNTTWNLLPQIFKTEANFNQKKIVNLQDYFPNRMLNHGEVHGLFFLEKDNITNVRTLSHRESFEKLLALAFLNAHPVYTKENFKFLSLLCRSIPCFALRFNMDFKKLNSDLMNLLSKIPKPY